LERRKWQGNCPLHEKTAYRKRVAGKGEEERRRLGTTKFFGGEGVERGRQTQIAKGHDEVHAQLKSVWAGFIPKKEEDAG